MYIIIKCVDTNEQTQKEEYFSERLQQQSVRHLPRPVWTSGQAGAGDHGYYENGIFIQT